MTILVHQGSTAFKLPSADGSLPDQDGIGSFPHLSPIRVKGGYKGLSSIVAGRASEGAFLAQIVICGSYGEIALAAHTQVAADEGLEVAVEDLVYVADFDAGA
jgi:hypothetical protein